MKFSKTLILGIFLTITQVSVSIAGLTTAAEWAKTEKAKLDTINKVTMAALVKGAPATYVKLFAAVKSNYKSDPVEITRIGALTQFVVTSGNIANCKRYADELIKAAKASTSGDVTSFFIDQLRWCATPQQTKAIREFESSKQAGVAALAKIAVFASEDNFESQQQNAKKSVCSEYMQKISKMKTDQKLKALLVGFDSPDLKISGTAMRVASQIDIQDKIAEIGGRQAKAFNQQRIAAGQKATVAWTKKLQSTSNPIRKVMLLDMLGARGNPAAAAALAACMNDANLSIAAAAQNALANISPAAYAEAAPAMLKKLLASHISISEKTILRLPTKLIEVALLKNYENYSKAGQQVTLDVLSIRRSNSGIILAIAAINGSDSDRAITGYRLLKNCATAKETDILVGKLFVENGKRLQEAQSAVAMAAKRDASGSYISKLADTYSKGDTKVQQRSLEVFGRIGSKELLTLTEGALKTTDKDLATAAVRALAAWDNNDSIKALMLTALNSSDKKQRILSQRGIEKKLTAKGVKKAPYSKMWADVSKSAQGNAEMKTKLDEFFKK